MTSSRLIALALLAGEFLFAGVIWFLATQGEPRGMVDRSFADPMQMAALAAGFAMMPAAWFVRRSLLARADSLPEAQQPQVRQVAFITAMALLEGGVLFNLVAWLITGVPMPNVAVAGLLVVVQLLVIPRD